MEDAEVGSWCKGLQSTASSSNHHTLASCRKHAGHTAHGTSHGRAWPYAHHVALFVPVPGSAVFGETRERKMAASTKFVR